MGDPGLALHGRLLWIWSRLPNADSAGGQPVAYASASNVVLPTFDRLAQALAVAADRFLARCR